MEEKGAKMEASSDGGVLRPEGRRLRRGTVAGVSLLVLLNGWILVDRFRTPQDLQARGFTLVDEQGRPLAHLARTPKGAVLALESRSGSAKIFLGVADDVIGLALSVNDGVRASLTVGNEGEPVFSLRDAAGRARVVSAIDQNDNPAISVWNAAGGLDFIVRPGTEGVVQAFDADGRPLVIGRAQQESPDRR